MQMPPSTALISASLTALALFAAGCCGGGHTKPQDKDPDELCERVKKTMGSKFKSKDMKACVDALTELRDDEPKMYACMAKCTGHKEVKRLNRCQQRCDKTNKGEEPEVEVKLGEPIDGATLVVKTLPKASVTVKVNRPSGAKGEPITKKRKASSKGKATFKFSGLSKGFHMADVSIKKGKKKGKASKGFKVNPKTLVIEPASGEAKRYSSDSCTFTLSSPKETAKVFLSKGPRDLKISMPGGESVTVDGKTSKFKSGTARVTITDAALIRDTPIAKLVGKPSGEIPITFKTKGGTREGTVRCNVASPLNAAGSYTGGSPLKFEHEAGSAPAKKAALYVRGGRFQKAVGDTSTTLAGIAYIAVGTPKARAAGSCPYSDGTSRVVLKRKLYTQSVVLYDRHTGKAKGRKTFSPKAPKCPSSIPSTRSKDITAFVPQKDIVKWIEAQL